MENSFVVKIKDEIKIVEVKDINSLVLMNHDLSYREKPEVVTMQELLARNPKLIPTNKYAPKTLIGKVFRLKVDLCSLKRGTKVIVDDIRGNRCILFNTLGNSTSWQIPRVAIDVVLDMDYVEPTRYGKVLQDFCKIPVGEVVKINEYPYDDSLVLLTTFDGFTQVCSTELLEDRLQLI